MPPSHYGLAVFYFYEFGGKMGGDWGGEDIQSPTFVKEGVKPRGGHAPLRG